MPKNKCIFQAKWLDDPLYSQWLKEKCDEVALCSYCKKEINIGNMGETALTSQLKGKKHLEISKFFCTNPITSLLKKPNETENKSQDDMPQTSKKQVSIDNLVVSNATNKTAIRWVLNMVCSKYLKNFSSNVIRLFATMFPDGEIAKNFQQKISSSPHQVVSFDESLNYSFQKGQMDLLICYWDNDTDRVCTHYMGSGFMGCSTADNVLETFQNRISEVDESKSHLMDLMSTLHF